MIAEIFLGGFYSLLTQVCLTYMSKSDDLQRALASGRLRTLPMRSQSDAELRVVLLSEEVSSLVLGPYLTDAHAIRANMLRSDLESFVKGSVVSMSLTPKKAKTANFGLLKPISAATFDFRSREPSPSIRILGHFLEADKFVALTWRPKRVQVNWSNRIPLGDDERLWAIAMHECQEKWFDILPNCVPACGNRGNVYVSNKLFIV